MESKQPETKVEESKKRKLEDEETQQSKSLKSSTEKNKEDGKVVQDDQSIQNESDPTILKDIPKELIIQLEDLTSKPTTIITMKANKYIKFILNQWSQHPDYDQSLLLDTKKSLFPLCVSLRKNNLDQDQLISLLTILYHLQHGEFMKSTESYMKLSIGNVAWPIGVISVSIHARSRDSKLNNGGANIMIDEKTRKWITSMKRLITFSEVQYRK
ncbi:Pre-mRNA-splicing factor [Wickerhamomyces ciferrii]|uniref:Pre-mRNA-splicing factor 18 n=1 Tax=Wickerhamomyces ciferrii (strain ATCC 14091 / BCRC 22168 / CBS 111 / JCM 3599 / NBRC 0793 / NRRL Y-1031 F-60-10) TaxID=1206466 RepID=K0L0J4_WICCF|nr:Pre-mRNA-splicing factor [Wickerhamomyces ciferrii]CCH47094.1 Pre-mRNA-splicing factor [Wickerhamomyces ciferrii]